MNDPGRPRRSSHCSSTSTRQQHCSTTRMIATTQISSHKFNILYSLGFLSLFLPLRSFRSLPLPLPLALLLPSKLPLPSLPSLFLPPPTISTLAFPISTSSLPPLPALSRLSRLPWLSQLSSLVALRLLRFRALFTTSRSKPRLLLPPHPVRAETAEPMKLPEFEGLRSSPLSCALAFSLGFVNVKSLASGLGNRLLISVWKDSFEACVLSEWVLNVEGIEGGS